MNIPNYCYRVINFQYITFTLYIKLKFNKNYQFTKNIIRC